jgi:hypothetical protein
MSSPESERLPDIEIPKNAAQELRRFNPLRSHPVLGEGDVGLPPIPSQPADDATAAEDGAEAPTSEEVGSEDGSGPVEEAGYDADDEWESADEIEEE